MRTARRWTEEEREIVRRDYRSDKCATHSLAVKLGRSFFAVKDMAQKLGVSRSKPLNWTEEEISLLPQLMGKHSPRKVAKMMGRSENAVIVKAKRLKLSWRHRDGWYTQSEVCEILGVDHRKIAGYAQIGRLKMVRHKEGVIPSSNGGTVWEIQEEDLKRFLIRFGHEFTGRNVDLGQVITILVGG